MEPEVQSGDDSVDHIQDHRPLGEKEDLLEEEEKKVQSNAGSVIAGDHDIRSGELTVGTAEMLKLPDEFENNVMVSTRESTHEAGSCKNFLVGTAHVSQVAGEISKAAAKKAKRAAEKQRKKDAKVDAKAAVAEAERAIKEAKEKAAAEAEIARKEAMEKAAAEAEIARKEAKEKAKQIADEKRMKKAEDKKLFEDRKKISALKAKELNQVRKEAEKPLRKARKANLKSESTLFHQKD